jgi:hypothetical protein
MVTPSLVERVAARYAATVASSPEQWEMAAEILAQGEHHPAIAVIKTEYDNVIKELHAAAQKSANMKRIGVGRTEDPTLILTMVAPAIKELAETAERVVHQLEQRLK